MKIGRSKVSTTKTTSSMKRGRTSATEQSPKPYSAQDVTTIAGIPEAELTPKVQTALSKLIEEVQTLRSQVQTLQSQLSEAQHQAEFDPLLDIPNRRAFVRDLSRELAMAERYKTEAALIFIDLNDLKSINDTHGHAAGDAALKHLADLLQSNIRAVDSFGRIGGDEFGLILKNANRDIAVHKIAILEDILATHPLLWSDLSLPLKMACGIVDINGTHSVEETLAHADRAMYADKNQRKKDVNR